MWNELSNVYTFFTFSTIGSPISFWYKNFRLQEFPTADIPQPLFNEFLTFCYPEDMPDRQEEIACDKQHYWEKTSTFLVFKNDQIVGCVQIVPKTATQNLPVEYADVQNDDGTKSKLDISRIISTDNVTEIYRCRRSFDLRKIEAINVLLMLYKAVWAKVIQLGTAYTCISFDSAKNDLRSLYLNKLNFDDPNISLVFGNSQKRWSLLLKDWERHEQCFATLSKSHFYLQTWFRESLKKKHLHIINRKKVTARKAILIKSDKLLIAQTLTASQSVQRRKGTPCTDPTHHRQ